jgi:hypothetical protein
VAVECVDPIPPPEQRRLDHRRCRWRRLTPPHVFACTAATKRRRCLSWRRRRRRRWRHLCDRLLLVPADPVAPAQARRLRPLAGRCQSRVAAPWCSQGGCAPSRSSTSCATRVWK